MSNAHANNHDANKRFTDIDLRYHLIWDYSNKEIVKQEYIGTKHNVIGITTKPLWKLRHNYFTNVLLQDPKIWIKEPNATCTLDKYTKRCARWS